MCILKHTRQRPDSEGLAVTAVLVGRCVAPRRTLLSISRTHRCSHTVEPADAQTSARTIRTTSQFLTLIPLSVSLPFSLSVCLCVCVCLSLCVCVPLSLCMCMCVWQIVEWEDGGPPTAATVDGANNIFAAFEDTVRVFDVEGEPVTDFVVDLTRWEDKHDLLHPKASSLQALQWHAASATLVAADCGNNCAVLLGFDDPESLSGLHLRAVLRHRDIGKLAGVLALPSSAAGAGVGAGAGAGAANSSAGLTTVVVADALCDVLHVFDATKGSRTNTVGSSGRHAGGLSSPQGLAASAAGDIVVVDEDNHRVQVLGTDGRAVLQIGERGYDDGEFRQPHGVTVTAGGDIVVADTGNSRVQGFSADGTHLWTLEAVDDHTFDAPFAVAMATDGDVLVCDKTGAAWVPDPTAEPKPDDGDGDANDGDGGSDAGSVEAAVAAVGGADDGGSGGGGGGNDDDNDAEVGGEEVDDNHSDDHGDDSASGGADENEDVGDSNSSWTLSTTSSAAAGRPESHPMSERARRRVAQHGAVTTKAVQRMPPYMQHDMEDMAEDMKHLRRTLQRLRKQRREEMDNTKKCVAARKALQAQLAPHAGTLATHGIFVGHHGTAAAGAGGGADTESGGVLDGTDWSACRSLPRLEDRVLELKLRIGALQKAQPQWQRKTVAWKAREAAAKEATSKMKGALKGVKGTTRHSETAARKQVLKWEDDRAQAQLALENATAAAELKMRKLDVAVQTVESELDGVSAELARARADVAKLRLRLGMQRSAKSAMQSERDELVQQLVRAQSSAE